MHIKCISIIRNVRHNLCKRLFVCVLYYNSSFVVVILTGTSHRSLSFFHHTHIELQRSPGFGLYYSIYYHVAVKMASKNDTYDVYDTLKENIMRAIDEMAKIQPQISQSVSNLQIDYIQTAKNIIHNAVSAQKQFVSSLNIPVAEQYSEQFSKQSTEITNNAIKAVGINNQLAINTLDATRENLRSEEHTSELQSQFHLVCRLLLE